ncbi:hypothetical protein KWH04_23865, partial [Xanthomonas campestris pv. trichodesmae]|nr:hypothetical protein [Xanthomonas campestris pv. trichodesmae]
GENLFDFFMASSSQELKPPQNPGRFIVSKRWSLLTIDGRRFRRCPTTDLGTGIPRAESFIRSVD